MRYAVYEYLPNSWEPTEIVDEKATYYVVMIERARRRVHKIKNAVYEVPSEFDAQRLASKLNIKLRCAKRDYKEQCERIRKQCIKNY